MKSGLVKAFNLLDEPKILEKGAVVDEVKAESDSIETLLKKKAALEYEIEQMKDKINSNNESPNKNQ